MKSVEYVIRINDQGATEVVKRMGDEVAKTNKAFEQGGKTGQREIKAQAGSIDDLNRRIKALTEARNRFANPAIVDNYNKRIRALTEEKLRLQGVTDKVEESTRQWGLGTVAVAAVAAKAVMEVGRAFVRTAAESVELAKRQQQAEQRVESLVKTTGQAAGFAADELKRQAAEMQALTTFGDEAILEAQAKLLTFLSVSGDVFKRAQMAAADLAATGFGTLEQSITQLGKALEDPTQGLSALRRVGVSFSEQQVEQIQKLQEQGDLYEAQVLLLSQVEAQVKGTAEALAQTPTGQIEQLRNLTSDLKENFGLLLLQGSEPFVRSMRGLVEVALEYTRIRVSDQLRTEQAEFMATAKAVQDGALSQENRNRALRELARLSPDIIGKLDLERVSNEDLAKAVAQVNTSYMERIRLQAALEVYQEAFAKAAKAEAESLRATIDFNKEVNRLAAQRPGLDLLNKTLDEQKEIVRELARQGLQSQAALQGAGVSASGAAAALTRMESAQKASAQAQAELNEVLSMTDVIEARTEEERQMRTEREPVRRKTALEELIAYNELEWNIQLQQFMRMEAEFQAHLSRMATIEDEMEAQRAAHQQARLQADIDWLDQWAKANDAVIDHMIRIDRESADNAEAQAERRRAARKAEADANVAAAAVIIMSNQRQIRSGQDVANAVLDQALVAIQAKLAESVASGLASVFASVPFPANIVAASAISGLINLMFNQLRGGLTGGRGGSAAFREPAGIGTIRPQSERVNINARSAPDGSATARQTASSKVEVRVTGTIDNEVIRLSNQRADDVRSMFV